MNRLFSVLASLLILLLAGCASSPSWMEYQIFCGQSFDAGRQTIPASEWEKFCDEVVAREFPNGFTICDADGRWLHEGKIPVREKNKILLIVTSEDEKSSAAIHRITEQFRIRFQQESVLLVRHAFRIRMFGVQDPGTIANINTNAEQLHLGSLDVGAPGTIRAARRS